MDERRSVSCHFGINCVKLFRILLPCVLYRIACVKLFRVFLSCVSLFRIILPCMLFEPVSHHLAMRAVSYCLREAISSLVANLVVSAVYFPANWLFISEDRHVCRNIQCTECCSRVLKCCSRVLKCDKYTGRML